MNASGWRRRDYNDGIMASNDKAKGMKSAYELALERMESQGIDRPSATTLSDATKQAIADARALTQAKMAKLTDPLKREEQEEFYLREHETLTRDGEAKVDKIKAAAEKG